MNSNQSSDQFHLQEFSVVYTSNSLNHMSISFQLTMKEISEKLKLVYGADGCVLVPGYFPSFLFYFCVISSFLIFSISF